LAEKATARVHGTFLLALAGFMLVVLQWSCGTTDSVTEIPVTPSVYSNLVADFVVGQPNFDTNAIQTVNELSLNSPKGIYVDDANTLYVVDNGNNRVLIYNDPTTFDQQADTVIGQPNFDERSSNNGGLSASSLSSPEDVFVDDARRIYVTDAGNNRLLIFLNPSQTGASADTLLGQTSFDTNSANQDGLSAITLNNPSGIFKDGDDRLYVVDRGNNRVLIFDDLTTTDTVADRVIGQTDFTNGDQTSVTASSVSAPEGIFVDVKRQVFVGDASNNRVLIYQNPNTTDTIADIVLGQGPFTENTANYNDLSSRSLQIPTGLFVDFQNFLFVCDASNNRVLIFDASSTDTQANHVIGQGNTVSNSPNFNGSFNLPTSSSLFGPNDVVVDNKGVIYVSDQLNNRVVIYNPFN